MSTALRAAVRARPWRTGALVLLAALAFSPTAAMPPVAAATRCVDPASWSTSRLANAALVVPVEESDVASVAAEVRSGAGGVLLLGSSGPSDLAAALRQLVAGAPAGVAPWVMVDEEGGAVQRLANLVGEVSAPRYLGETETPAAIESLATTLGQKLLALGVTMDLAPVLDADGGPGPNAADADGTRSFSASPARAAADGLAFAEGLEHAGVVPVVKHFPGLGGATGNTDLVVASTKPWSSLVHGGLVPFADAVRARLPAVMVANAAVPGLTNLPASLSPTVITHELRQVLGFHGLVLTDSLSAVSVSGRGYGLGSGAVAALGAGADLVLYNATTAGIAAVTSEIVTAITRAVALGHLSRARLVGAASEDLATHGATVCR